MVSLVFFALMFAGSLAGLGDFVEPLTTGVLGAAKMGALPEAEPVLRAYDLFDKLIRWRQ